MNDKVNLHAREHPLFPWYRSGVAMLICLLAATISLAIFPLATFNSGLPASTVIWGWALRVVVLLFNVAWLILIWLEWSKRGVEYDEDTRLVRLHFPTWWGLGDPRIEELAFEDRRVERRPVAPILNLVVGRVAFDDKRTNEDFVLWPTTREETAWLLRTSRSKKEKKEKKGEKGSSPEGDAFLATAVRKAVAAYGDNTPTGLLAALVVVADDARYEEEREEALKLIGLEVVKGRLPKT